MDMSQKRIGALQEKLRRGGLDGALYATGANFVYLLDATGFHWQRSSETMGPGSEGYAALAIPDCLLFVPAQGGASVICVPHRAQDLAPYCAKVYPTYLDHFGETLRKITGGGACKLAAGDACYDYFENEMFTEVQFKPTFVRGEHLVTELRCFKDEKEIGLLRDVARLTDKAMGEVVSHLKAGITPYEIEQMLVDIGLANGCQDLSFVPAGLFVKTGHPTAGDIMGCPKDMPLTEGTSIFFDYGYVLNGYSSDFGRSFYYGETPSHLSAAYRALQGGQCEMIKRIVPGKTNINELFSIIEEQVHKAGFTLLHADTGTVGHQIGIDCHELPWMDRSGDFILRPGMVFCSEPKIFFPGECYMRVEDMVLITENGAEFLTDFDRELFALPR